MRSSWATRPRAIDNVLDDASIPEPVSVPALQLAMLARWYVRVALIRHYRRAMTRNKHHNSWAPGLRPIVSRCWEVMVAGTKPRTWCQATSRARGGL
jgi:hypothetical protein